jgi:hypothetical protein
MHQHSLLEPRVRQCNSALVTLQWDRDQAVDLAALRGVLDQPRVTAWSGTNLASNESHDGLWLRLTVADQRVCRIKVHADVPSEVCDPLPGWWRMALVGAARWSTSPPAASKPATRCAGSSHRPPDGTGGYTSTSARCSGTPLEANCTRT